MGPVATPLQITAESNSVLSPIDAAAQSAQESVIAGGRLTPDAHTAGSAVLQRCDSARQFAAESDTVLEDESGTAGAAETSPFR